MGSLNNLAKTNRLILFSVILIGLVVYGSFWLVGMFKPTSVWAIHSTDESTVIASHWSGGVVLSNKNGVNWESYESPIIEEFVRDETYTIWGLYGRQGISEDSTAYLSASQDGGKSWEQFVLDASSVIPIAFLSDSVSEPIILDTNGFMWRVELIENQQSQDIKLHQLTKKAPLVFGNRALDGIYNDQFYYVSTEEFVLFAREPAYETEILPIPNIVQMDAVDDQCVAIAQDATIYRFICGQDEWEPFAKSPPLDLIFDLELTDEGLILVAGEAKNDWMAVGIMIDQNGDITIPTGLDQCENSQAYDIHEDYSGRIWLATSCGVHLLQNGQWVKRLEH